MQTSHQPAYQNLNKSNNRSKEYYDEATRTLKLLVGDKVLLFDETVRRGRSRKLSAPWIGPYTVTEGGGQNYCSRFLYLPKLVPREMMPQHGQQVANCTLPMVTTQVKE